MALSQTAPIGGARDLATGLDAAYFVASNPTPGTGITGHAAPTTLDDTKPLLYLFNSGSKRVCPMYLRLTLTAASVGNTVQRFTQILDGAPQAGVTRYSSGGTQLIPKSTNQAAQIGSDARVYFGAVTAAAATAAKRIVFNQTYRTVLGVVADVYQFNWASHQVLDPASLITTGTAVSHVSFHYAPVVVGPGQSFLVHQWAASQSAAPDFEVEFAYIEIP